MIQPVYLDNAATTRVDPIVVEAMLPWLAENFGNPASVRHAYGWDAEEAVERARRQVAGAVGASPQEIVWTSGATESDNLAIKGVAGQHGCRGRHIVTVRTEHKAVLDTCRALEQQGFEITLLDVQPNGLLDPHVFSKALRPDTILASVMYVNNEIGVIQDIPLLGRLCREHGVLFHVDAAQAAGKLPIDLSSLDVDLMSFSAHKVYGPQGIGALYVRRQPFARLQAQMHGGGHERGMRSGTLPVHQIVGMGKAFELVSERIVADTEHILGLQQRLWQGLSQIERIHLNGDMIQRVPHLLNISFSHIEGEALMMSLQGLAVSSGSACTSAMLEPSHVLRALGHSHRLSHASLRLSLGRFNTWADIDMAIAIITQQVQRLREIAPTGMV